MEGRRRRGSGGGRSGVGVFSVEGAGGGGVLLGGEFVQLIHLLLPLDLVLHNEAARQHEEEHLESEYCTVHKSGMTTSLTFHYDSQ